MGLGGKIRGGGWEKKYTEERSLPPQTKKKILGALALCSMCKTVTKISTDIEKVTYIPINTKLSKIDISNTLNLIRIRPIERLH